MTPVRSARATRWVKFAREGRAVDGDVNVELGQVEDGWLTQGPYVGGFDLAPCDSDVLHR